MRRSAGLVFDEFVQLGESPVYTSTELNELLATADQMGIQVVVDEVSAQMVPMPVIPKVSVQIQTSADGIHWATKNASPEVNGVDVPPGTTTVSPYSGDSGLLPTLVFVRLKVSLTATAAPASAHIRVYVTLRDGGDVHEVNRAPKGLLPEAVQEMLDLFGL